METLENDDGETVCLQCLADWVDEGDMSSVEHYELCAGCPRKVN
jgi:hypothetical protein